jgi:PDZ domain
MSIHFRFPKSAVLLLVATPIVAQENSSCVTGPGAAFGIVGYQCANCGVSRANGRQTSYSFFAEPVVVEAAEGSRILAGDVVEAVNGQPITTRSGSDQFTYPRAGENSLTVRRGRDHRTIRLSISSSGACDGSSGGVHPGVGLGSGAGAGSGVSGSTGAGTGTGVGRAYVVSLRDWGFGSIRFTSRSDTGPLIIIDGVVQNGNFPSLSAAKIGKYGFAVSCEPSCTAATDTDGPLIYTYYKYDVPPPIAAVRAGSPSERAGVRLGDVLLRIDGKSIVDPEGALALARIDKQESIRLTVRRDGKEQDFVIHAAR